MAKDYYQELGVPRDAEAASIKQAYRRKAQKCHPDVSRVKGAAERFKRVRAAYEVLSDPARRAEYDADLRRPKDVRRARAMDFADLEDWVAPLEPQPEGGLFGESDLEFINEFLDSLGLPFELADFLEEPVHAEVALSRQEAAAGCAILVEACLETKCLRCGGAGRIAFHSCPSCDGSGAKQALVDATLRIPPGARHGQTITVPIRRRGCRTAFVRVRVLVRRAERPARR